eukprot:TRINITY_DN8479_c0_g1_i2.p1 TRINITY_DN8479_c0_g1~~TRINITY_DN8479_c0_g1_i2.p1  ORF type:complete len:545 (+),score=106.13 TRINITY_DN8479_c0_g1_i2:56-1690(+)
MAEASLSQFNLICEAPQQTLRFYTRCLRMHVERITQTHDSMYIYFSHDVHEEIHHPRLRFQALKDTKGQLRTNDSVVRKSGFYLQVMVEDLEYEMSIVRAAGFPIRISPQEFHKNRVAVVEDPNGYPIQYVQTPEITVQKELINSPISTSSKITYLMRISGVMLVSDNVNYDVYYLQKIFSKPENQQKGNIVPPSNNANPNATAGTNNSTAPSSQMTETKEPHPPAQENQNPRATRFRRLSTLDKTPSKSKVDSDPRVEKRGFVVVDSEEFLERHTNFYWLANGHRLYFPSICYSSNIDKHMKISRSYGEYLGLGFHVKNLKDAERILRREFELKFEPEMMLPEDLGHFTCIRFNGILVEISELEHYRSDSVDYLWHNPHVQLDSGDSNSSNPESLLNSSAVVTLPVPQTASSTRTSLSRTGAPRISIESRMESARGSLPQLTIPQNEGWQDDFDDGDSEALQKVKREIMMQRYDSTYATEKVRQTLDRMPSMTARRRSFNPILEEAKEMTGYNLNLFSYPIISRRDAFDYFFLNSHSFYHTCL